ncbi:uncharacterized protein LOC135499788 [Lineus longissimus]|uniref:uncharacterized protein LOC135499788 n=1 Tax=Lineus longissimus TaxID=88925 RepID=UPI002B4EB9B0
MKLVLCLIVAAVFALVVVSADEPDSFSDFAENLDAFDFPEELEKRHNEDEFGGCNASGNKVKISKSGKVTEKACVGEWSSWTRCRPWRKVSKRVTCKVEDKKTKKCKELDEEERPCKR